MKSVKLFQESTNLPTWACSPSTLDVVRIPAKNSPLMYAAAHILFLWYKSITHSLFSQPHSATIAAHMVSNSVTSTSHNMHLLNKLTKFGSATLVFALRRRCQAHSL